MKKKILILLVFAFLASIPAFATDKPKNAPKLQLSNLAKIKNLAYEYTSINLQEKDGSSIKILDEMTGLGAKNLNVRTYSPCSCRGTITINGKQIDAKNRRCAVLKYSYKNKDYEFGRCSEPVN